MEKLSKIIVQKFFPQVENLKPPDLLTDEEYHIVKNCRLNDLLQTERNPAVLDRICEGEKLQTAEFYQQKEKRYKRDVSKLYRNTGKDSTQPPRTVRQVVPTHDNPPITHGNQTSTRDTEPPAQLMTTEEVMEPTRSKESNEPQNDPYLMREEITPIPIVMPLAVLPEDENFGSNDVDGARDFLQLCTGEELPPMSMRQTTTRDMLLSQLPSIHTVPALVDNFQELDLKSINTFMFKRPMGASTPLGTFPDSSVQDAQIPLPAQQDLIAQEAVGVHSEVSTIAMAPATVQTNPTVESSGPANSGVSIRPAVVESSSSTDESEAPAPRPRRIRREASFTERLEPFEMTVSMPRPRRNFDIFSFPNHAIFNKTIQDVQNLLSESIRQVQFREISVMRKPAIDSGFQQTPDEFSRRPATLIVNETSNLVTIDKMGDKDSNVQSNLENMFMTPGTIASMQPNDLDALATIDGQLTEVSDRFPSKPLADATSTSHEKTATKQLAPLENVSTLQQSPKNNDIQPVVEPDSRAKKISKRGNRDKKTQTVQNENDPILDVSSVLFNQAKELETIVEHNEAEEELLPLDAMLVDILLTVQGALNSEGQLGHPISIQRLAQLLRINSRLGGAKLFKNIILLKQADLLAVECDSKHHITKVSLKLPQVDVL